MSGENNIEHLILEQFRILRKAVEANTEILREQRGRMAAIENRMLAVDMRVGNVLEDSIRMDQRFDRIDDRLESIEKKLERVKI